MKKIEIMGIVNVTSDSFYDGGKYISTNQAIEHGIKLWEEGADILDIGGESSRPGALPIDEQEELRRVIPVVAALALKGIRISVDTWRAKVMAESIAAGAEIINDITALEGDSEAVSLIAKSKAKIILMHMQGRPSSMQLSPSYLSAPLEVKNYLCKRIKFCQDAGITKEKIVIDPGIGFGKTLEHNLQIMANIGLLQELGCKILVGASRKSFISMQCGNVPPAERLPGSLIAAAYLADKGAEILRVHDVKETKQAIEIWQAIRVNESYF